MSAYRELQNRYFRFDALQAALGLMSWDRQVLMPPGGMRARTQHATRIAALAHEQLVSVETERLIDQASKEIEPGTEEAAVLRVLRRKLEIERKLPLRLVEEKSRTSNDGYEVWRAARSESNFTKLAPYLEKLFDIAGETAQHLGYENHIYDPLLDLFEEGATYQTAKALFDGILEPIRSIVQLQEETEELDDSFLYSHWDSAKLVRFGAFMAEKIGFDFSRGRIDLTSNAFCSGTSSDDVRLTARAGRHIGAILFSSLHEMGHGLYEQNSHAKWIRTPLAGGASLGLHESQSRTWENIVGRSRGFWTYFYPMLQEAFPELRKRSLETFYRAINKVKPGPIRIGSDEVTYNLHILIRFELECDVLTGRVKVKELPEAWNAKYESYLGISPANDAEGCLQDVHWARGSVGYFPTYSMGNLIGWQIWRCLEKDIPDPESLMAKGEFRPMLDWLTEKIYSQGKKHMPRELLVHVTQKPMAPTDYVQAMQRKYHKGVVR